MAAPRNERDDAISMHTLDDRLEDSQSDNDSSTTLIDYGQQRETARKELPLSPSRSSSFFSTPPMSTTDLAPDTNSEFSYEEAPLLGNTTPPPEYRSPRTSIARAIAETVRVNRAQAAQPPSAQTVRESPNTKCKNGECRRYRRWGTVSAFVFVLVVTPALIGLISYTIVSSVRKHKQRVHYSAPPMPGWASDCGDNKHYSQYSYNGIRDLEISDGHRGGFSGTIKILPSLPGQTDELVMSVGRKSPPLNVRVNARDTVGALSPAPASAAREQPQKRNNGCGKRDVLLYFRDGLEINNFALSTSSGRIQIHSKLRVSNATTISTKDARIEFGLPFNTRKTYINSGSSSLEGTFKLYDLLSIASTSGSINVAIAPQEADKAHPKPAELQVESQSGMIQLSTVGLPPVREYITSVQSRDGKIQGTLLHGSKTTVKSLSGMIELRILPYVFTGYTASSLLDIDTSSGRQQVTIEHPPSGKLDHMQSTHTSQSGALQLKYPQAWAGKISGSSSSGRVDVTGFGVHIIEQDTHYVDAEKDDGDSSLTFRASSGSASLDFGI